jgi:hypothetical protein
VLGPNSGGVNGYVAVDAIQVMGGWVLNAALPLTTIDQTHTSTRWSPGWNLATSPKYFRGSQKWSASSSTHPMTPGHRHHVDRQEGALVWPGSSVPGRR